MGWCPALPLLRIISKLVLQSENHYKDKYANTSKAVNLLFCIASFTFDPLLESRDILNFLSFFCKYINKEINLQLYILENNNHRMSNRDWLVRHGTLL